jgi:phosphohistidine phosphatase
MTTRTLILLRHAKAAGAEGAPDRDRPLTPRGHADAAAAGVWLSHLNICPDLVLCSPARRTRQTWHGVAVALAGTPDVRYEEQLYGASVAALLGLVTAVGDEPVTVALVGHNPTVSQLSALLDPAHADPEGMRTCALAVHTLQGSWSSCGPRRAQLTAAHTARA